MNPKLSSAILLLAAALFLVPTALYNFDNDANQGYQVVEEVILGPDNTFYYYSGNCEFAKNGIGNYIIENDTLKLDFKPMPIRNKAEYYSDSYHATDEEERMITIDLVQLNDTIYGKALICTKIYDKDSVLIDSKLLVANSDTTLKFNYPINTNYFNTSIVGIPMQTFDTPVTNNNNHTLSFTARCFISYFIQNETKHFYINKKQTNKSNQPLLITQEQDTLVIQPIK